MYEIKIRDVAEQTFLTEQAHVVAPALPPWIAAALDRQRAVATPVGPPVVIYHGEVNEESDGPVEAVTPIAPDVAASVSLPRRVEPAHREAYTSIKKSHVRFPEILSAYDAVESWIVQNGHTITGSPREVYFADFDAAGPDDLCVDIAFVIE